MTRLRIFEHTDSVNVQPASGKEEPTLWRSLAQREGNVSHSTAGGHEFPNGIAPEEFSAESLDGDTFGLKRRSMLKYMGASVALAGMGVSCRRPEDLILPYVKQPEEIIPGVANHYATSFSGPNGAVGLVVESHEGRPTKIEGNPDHVSSLGAAGPTEQSSILELYDPDRSRTPMQNGAASDWATFDAAFQTSMKKFEANGGQGLAFLSNGHESPTQTRLQSIAKKRFPKAIWSHYEPMAFDRTVNAAEMVFGPTARVHYDLTRAKIVLALDSNFLNEGPDHLRMARDFAAGRGFSAIPNSKAAKNMNRLYSVEGVFSLTGSNADHRMPLDTGRCGAFLKVLAGQLVAAGLELPEFVGGRAATLALKQGMAETFDAPDPKFLTVLAKDLFANRGRSVILVGERQPAAVQALAYLLNTALGGTTTSKPTMELTKAIVPGQATPVVSNAATAEGETETEEAKTDPEAAKEPHWALAHVGTHRSSHDSLKGLIAALNGNKVTTLVMVGVNPDYTSPTVLGFSDARKKAKEVIHVGLTADESAQGATWHLPLAHYLESWSDATAWDGTTSLVQPLIAPLHGARSETEFWSGVAGVKKKPYDSVRETWMSSLGVLADESAWRRSLHSGVLPEKSRAKSAWSTVSGESAVSKTVAALSKTKAKDGIEVVLTYDEKVGDGRSSNNSWMQELPDAMTKICWDNALLVGPTLARKLSLKGKVVENKYMGDVVTVTAGAQTITIPAFIVPGMAPNTAQVALGYGRRNAGFIGNGVGTDGSPLLPEDGSRVLTGASIAATGALKDICSTQDHFSLDWEGHGTQELPDDQMNVGFQTKRPIAVSVTAADYGANPEIATKGSLRSVSKGVLVEKDFAQKNPSLPDRPIQLTKEVFTYEGQQWGLVFDMSSCTGCNACVVACQAENNIPVVGRDEVFVGREMHWIRIDRYFSGNVNNPRSIQQPVICMHCENAPCEPVCPVAATVHDTEGTNGMIYNRCIGTRYCANNCPVKVRRFNYFDYTHTAHLYVEETQEKRHSVLKMQRNPDVSVRFRGVMEKCSFCTQRIQEAKYAAKRKGTDSKNLPDGAINPACAQTCPSQAIVFGNINDAKSKVAQQKKSERNYEVLSELNIRPRTTYLAKLSNPHSELG
jgi:Fe-S-cluster-containing dehydrogenase component/anaerobic selenocysteine-containing dehydrogenase